MSTKAPKIDTPADPDPRPVSVSDSKSEMQQARREEQKRAVGTYGRQKTILSVNEGTADGKKNILGG